MENLRKIVKILIDNKFESKKGVSDEKFISDTKLLFSENKTV